MINSILRHGQFLVDYRAGIEKLTSEELEPFKGRNDELPHIVLNITPLNRILQPHRKK
jgi:hypothetical protein